MPFSQSLAQRVRQILADQHGIVEKKMFGGLGFLLHGNLLVGIWHTSLISRIGPEQYQVALTEPNVREFDITGRPMRGWVMVEADGIDSDDRLRAWIDRSLEFVVNLPAK
jgi:hypothetical protein